MFRVHLFSASGDKTYLICHVTTKGYVIKWSYNMGLKPLIVRYHSTEFTGHRHFGNDDITVFICHIILRDHVIKGLCDLMGKIP